MTFFSDLETLGEEGVKEDRTYTLLKSDNLVSLKVQDKDVKNLSLNLVLGILTSLFLLNYIVTIVRSNSMLGEVVRSQFVEKRRQVKNFEKCE